MSLRIGMDGRIFARKRTGIGRYVTEVCIALDRLLGDAEFFVYSPAPVKPPVHSERWHLRVGSRFSRADGPGSFLWYRTWGVGAAATRDGLDAFWGTETFLPRLPDGVRSVSTVYDLMHIVAPRTMSRKGLLGYRAFFAPDVRRADSVVAISQGTSDRLSQLIGRPADAVALPATSFRAPPPDEVAAVRRRHGLEEPYLLSVATWEPRKNLELLMRTVVELGEEGRLGGRRLALAGGAGWRDREPRRFAAENAGHHLERLGWVADPELPALYAGADAFLFPSLYEGFGLPVLEARACGTPVVTSDAPELREAGGRDALYVAPTREGLRTGILSVLSDEHRSTSSRELPTWNDAAAKMAAAFGAPVPAQEPSIP